MPVMAGWEIDDLKREQEADERWAVVKRLRDLTEEEMKDPRNIVECYKECKAFCDNWVGSTQEHMLARTGEAFGLVFSEPFLNKNREICMYIYDKTQHGANYVMGINLGCQRFQAMDVFNMLFEKLGSTVMNVQMMKGRDDNVHKRLTELVDDYFIDPENWTKKIRYSMPKEDTIQLPLDLEQVPRIANQYKKMQNGKTVLEEDFKEMAERWADCANYIHTGYHLDLNSVLLCDPEPYTMQRIWEKKSLALESTYYKRGQKALREALKNVPDHIADPHEEID